jgi:Flp pilus assembly pilin Flp
MDKLRAAVWEAAQQAARWQPRARWRAALGLEQGGGGEQQGQGLAEYALILALIAIVAIVSLAFLGNNIAELFWDPISDDFAEVLSRMGI